MKIYIMGGIFTHSNYEYIVEKSVSSIQNAADSFQKKILVSLSSQDIDGLFFLNFPFVGSYPKRFNDYIFKVDGECVYDKFKVFNYPFLNLPLIKLFARFFMSIKALSVKGVKEDDVLIIYSAHLPFIFASFIFRFFSKYKYKIVLFVPDLPEFMSEEQGFFDKIIKRIRSNIFQFFSKRSDGVVGLTDNIETYLGITPSKFIRFEGVGVVESFHEDLENLLPELPEKFFLYTGALESRYGIDVLVDWFKDDNFLPGWSLVLCGTGGLDAVISKLAKSKSKRVVFLGQVKRNIALELQKHADILVNPRSPIDEYTAYSFPSKTLEYMASGTPIVMHKLDGIPNEYFDYMYLPKTVTHAALKETLLEVASLSNQSRFDFGQKAKNFILFNKSPESQGKRLLNFLISISKG